VAVPPLTPEQRADALVKAAAVRAARADVRTKLKHNETSLVAVLKEGRTDDVVGRMRVVSLLEAMPGVGKARSREIMQRVGIADSRRVRGLGQHQVAALEREFGGSA
jgi:hypothetical protein